MSRIRVLVVDDSVVIRKLLCDVIASNAELELADTASGGAIALTKIPRVNPDIITLDVEMPGLNGIQTLTEIRKLYPRLPVIMFSTLTEKGANVTLEALSLGASDYVTKPAYAASAAGALEQVRKELIPKILSIAGKRRTQPVRPVPLKICRPLVTRRIDILAIGTSTGGPNALAEVIPKLPQNFPVPVVIVQHMPPLFTHLLAERLNSRSSLKVQEAVGGQELKPGEVWIARGDYHLTLSRTGPKVFLALNQDPPENSCRPAVDVLFRSVAQIYGPHVLGVVMTGMGSDGAWGAISVRNAGGEILVQDESSSVVWGMPGAVVSSGAADRICSLSEMSSEISRRINLSGGRDGVTLPPRSGASPDQGQKDSLVAE